MTDERLCAACGHVEYWHGEGSVPLPHPKSGPACARCMGQNDVDPWHDFSPPEAAPSTDEGEARFDPDAVAAARVRFPDPEPVHGVPVKADVVYALQHAYVEGWETGRAPLEERIRALQTTDYRCEEMCEAAQYGGSCRCSHLSNEIPAAEERIRELEADIQAMSDGPTHDEWWDMNLALQAEVERLREALGDIGRKAAWWGGVVRVEAQELVKRALATPPSSTEGTKEVEG